MKFKLPTSVLNTITSSYQNWSGFHDRAREFGKQSEFARRNSERIQAAALALEIGVIAAGSGAVIGATCGGPKGAAVGAGVGFVAGVACTFVVIEWEDDGDAFPYVTV
jgi:hypothetical protein